MNLIRPRCVVPTRSNPNALTTEGATMRTSRILMLSLAMGGAVLLAACGSDSNSSSASATATTAATATSGAATTAASGWRQRPAGRSGHDGHVRTTSAASATTAAPAGGGTALAVGQLNGKERPRRRPGLRSLPVHEGHATARAPATAAAPRPGRRPPSDSAYPDARHGSRRRGRHRDHPGRRHQAARLLRPPALPLRGDTAAGETNGQGSGGIWFLVDTEGNAVKYCAGRRLGGPQAARGAAAGYLRSRWPMRRLATARPMRPITAR